MVGHEVAAVAEPLGRRRPAVVEGEDPGGEEAAVEAVGDQIAADGGEDQPGGVDGLAAVQGDCPPAECAAEANKEGDQGRHLTKLPCYLEEGARGRMIPQYPGI